MCVVIIYSLTVFDNNENEDTVNGLLVNQTLLAAVVISVLGKLIYMPKSIDHCCDSQLYYTVSQKKRAKFETV